MILKVLILLLGITILLEKRHLHAEVSTCNNNISVEFNFTLLHQCNYKPTMRFYNAFVFQPFDDNSKSAIEIPPLYLLETVSSRNICLKRFVFALNNLFLIIFIFFSAGLQSYLEGMDKQTQDSPFRE